jgi:hypothetical protein
MPRTNNSDSWVIPCVYFFDPYLSFFSGSCFVLFFFCYRCHHYYFKTESETLYLKYIYEHTHTHDAYIHVCVCIHTCTWKFWLLFKGAFTFFFIYSHVHTLFGSFLPPAPCPYLFLPPSLTSRQNLFCLFLQFCWKEDISIIRKTVFLLVEIRIAIQRES